MEEGYAPKAKTVSIKFTSRASIKIGDSFYTIEACEERTIPDLEGVDVYKEREALWDTVNGECDTQIQEIIKTFRK